MGVKDSILEQAIEWMVKLQSGEASEEAYLECMAWRQEKQDHEMAWQQLQAINQRLNSLPGEIAHATLDDGNRVRQWERRSLLKSMALLLGTGAIGYGGYQYVPWQDMLADEATATGQQRLLTLADGSQLHINTKSAVDIRYDDSIRLIRLWHGEILVTTNHQNGDIRPLIVETAAGRIRALGTRFLVRQLNYLTRIHLYEGMTEIQATNSPQAVLLRAGEQLEFSAAAIGQVMEAELDAIAWIEGSIVAKNMRLAEFVEELGRYHKGILRCENTVADIQISGVYPVNDLHYVLNILATNFRIKIVSYSRYWIKLTSVSA